MAKKKSTKTKKKSTPRKTLRLTLTKQQKIVLGSFLALLGLALLISFISYFFTWQIDQSELGRIDRNTEKANWLNTFGSHVGHFFVYRGFGVASLIFAFLITLSGLYYFLDIAKKPLAKFWFWGILVMIWIAAFFGFFTETSSLFSGVIGYEMNDLMQDYLGLTGAILVMTFLAIVYLVLRLQITPEKVGAYFSKTKQEITDDFKGNSDEVAQTDYEKEVVENLTTDTTDKTTATTTPLQTTVPEESMEEPVLKTEIQKEIKAEDDVAMEVETAAEEETVEENLSKKLVEDFGQFDPRLELSNFKFPTIELLKDYTAGKGITINQEELEENKNRIVETLSNY
ncbi:MAG: DNA translocase FtsK 4TM domain-containing protein, partial [Marinirhabdus sp.]|nr:DNA translocase FtsK 4TM domain-containing protein [Marinirhabdus sp.]